MLISPEGLPLLTNFGLSSYVVNSSLKVSHQPTAEDNSMRWMAPERFETAEPTTEGDVWAFGMITLVRCLFELFMKFDIRDFFNQELFSRKVPFHEFEYHANVFKRIIQRKAPVRPSMNDTESRLTDDWWSLCCSCWDSDPSLRPSIDYLVGKTSYLLAHESRQPVLMKRTKRLSPTTQELFDVCPR